MENKSEVGMEAPMGWNEEIGKNKKTRREDSARTCSPSTLVEGLRGLEIKWDREWREGYSSFWMAGIGRRWRNRRDERDENTSVEMIAKEEGMRKWVELCAALTKASLRIPGPYKPPCNVRNWVLNPGLHRRLLLRLGKNKMREWEMEWCWGHERRCWLNDCCLCL